MRCFCALAVLACSVAVAAPPDRVLRAIDFEERPLGNAEELPMHWTKIQGAMLPHFVSGRLATDRSRSGRYSFRFDLNGGSLIYRYDPGRLKVQPGAWYRVQVFAQTTPLKHARARLTAYCLDPDGRMVDSTLRHSALHVSDRRAAEWTPLSIEVQSPATPGCTLVVELELLQPALYAPQPLGRQTLFGQDIRGSAWFDDLTIAQVPKVRLDSGRPGNILRAGEASDIQVQVNDAQTGDLSARLVLRDADGRVIHQRSGELKVARDGDGSVAQMALLLPALAPGWYEASIVTSSGGQVLGDQAMQLVALAERADVPPDDRFEIDATELSPRAWHRLPAILPQLGAGRVKLAIWSRVGDVEQLGAHGIDRLLGELHERNISPTACLLEPPPQIARKLTGARWTDLLEGPPDAWQPDLAALIARHAAHLDRWQVGRDGDDTFATTPAMRQLYQRVHGEFARLMHKPDLAMPWPAWCEIGDDTPPTIALSVPPSVLPHQVPLYLHDIARQGRNVSLYLRPLPRDQYGRQVQVRDLAQRVIHALAAGAKRITLPLPYSVGGEGNAIDERPDELLITMRVLLTTLSGTICRGKIPIGEGVEAFLFERDGRGIVAIWDRGMNGGVTQLALHLGDRPVSVDLWGNVVPLHKTGGNGQVKLALGQTPVFLLDIDAPLAQLRATTSFDQPLIESSFQAHTRRLRFTNPWRQAVSGTVRLKGPEGWSLSPSTFTFSANPGQTIERQISVQFPYNSFAGPRTIAVQFAVQADRNLTVEVPLTMTLGLSDVGMQSIAVRDGQDLFVQQVITNYSSRPTNYTAFALYPQQARQERLVIDLGPGHSTIKRYRFSSVQVTSQSTVRVGLKEIEGSRILNDEVPVR